MMFETILIANTIWFALAFHAFALRGKIFAKTLVPRGHRDTPAFEVLVATGKFIGGFNLALCIFNLLLLVNLDTFAEAGQRALICLFFALAHASQFIPNVFIALKNRKGAGVWQVKGSMRFIFVTDFVMMVGNIVVAGIYLQ